MNDALLESIGFYDHFPAMAMPATPAKLSNLELHYRLTAAADHALAEWHKEQGKPEMAEFFRSQAAIHLDMAAQVESEVTA